MFIRAALLVLVVLNLGVALWWLAQPEAPGVAVPTQDPGIPSLALLSESASVTRDTPPPADVAVEPGATMVDADPETAAPDTASTEVETVEAAAPSTAMDDPAPTEATPVVEHCYRLGPFTSETAARAVRAELGAIAKRPQIREIAAPAPPGDSRYRIIHPPLPNQEQAEAVARRIREAGFQDYFLITSGPQANAIALGLFRSREGAERQLKALKDAGFPVQLIPENESRPGPSQWWLDAQIADIAAARSTVRVGARQVQTLDCGTLH